MRCGHAIHRTRRTGGRIVSQCPGFTRFSLNYSSVIVTHAHAQTEGTGSQAKEYRTTNRLPKGGTSGRVLGGRASLVGSRAARDAVL
eukprot:3029577-Prymnesium_polylepis.1